MWGAFLNVQLFQAPRVVSASLFPIPHRRLLTGLGEKITIVKVTVLCFQMGLW